MRCFWVIAIVGYAMGPSGCHRSPDSQEHAEVKKSSEFQDQEEHWRKIASAMTDSDAKVSDPRVYALSTPADMKTAIALAYSELQATPNAELALVRKKGKARQAPVAIEEAVPAAEPVVELPDGLRRAPARTGEVLVRDAETQTISNPKPRPKKVRPAVPEAPAATTGTSYWKFVAYGAGGLVTYSLDKIVAQMVKGVSKLAADPATKFITSYVVALPAYTAENPYVAGAALVVGVVALSAAKGAYDSYYPGKSKLKLALVGTKEPDSLRSESMNAYLESASVMVVGAKVDSMDFLLVYDGVTLQFAIPVVGGSSSDLKTQPEDLANDIAM